MDPDREFDALLGRYDPSVQHLARELRSLVRGVMPEALELVDPPDKLIAYGFGRTYADLVCAIAPFKAHVNLMFSDGATLPDPHHLLTGTGKRARHVRVSEPGQIGDSALSELLRAAVTAHRRKRGGGTGP